MMMWHQDTHFVLSFLLLVSCFLSLYRMKWLFLLQEAKLWPLDSFLTVASNTNQGSQWVLPWKLKHQDRKIQTLIFLWESQGDKAHSAFYRLAAAKCHFLNPCTFQISLPAWIIVAEWKQFRQNLQRLRWNEKAAVIIWESTQLLSLSGTFLTPELPRRSFFFQLFHFPLPRYLPYL